MEKVKGDTPGRIIGQGKAQRQVKYDTEIYTSIEIFMDGWMCVCV